jgi:lysozyme family protein
MADFKKALPIVLLHEGGYVYDPDDPGGETNFGISKRSHPDINVKNMTRTDAEKIYQEEYWNKIRGDEIFDQTIAGNLFDFSVTSGVANAMTLLHNTIIQLTEEQQFLIGTDLIKVTNNFPFPSYFNTLFTIFRVKFYTTTAINFPLRRKYLKGWIARSFSFIK